MKPEFWQRLTTYKADGVFNPWLDHDEVFDLPEDGPLHRQRRLMWHLDCKPKFLLIGEAPGYRGCHFTGIPFTSEAQLQPDYKHYVSAPLACPSPFLWSKRITNRDLPFSEASATVIWRTLQALGIGHSTVLWNAFPFHPYQSMGMYSNRTPTPRELHDRLDILAMVIEEFRSAKLVAVGAVADRTLRSLNVYADRVVRHPSMGGARLFAEQMAGLVQENG
jgi:uracil-DNA glycosylase